MPVSLRVTLQGDRQLQKALKKLGRPGRNPIDSRALRRSVELVERTTQQEFLSGQVLGIRTGRLRESIETDVSGAPKFSEAGSDLVYAPTHEFGWPAKNIRAAHFLEGALERSLSRFSDIWAAEMERGVSEVRSAVTVASR